MKAALVGRGIGASLTPAMHEAEGRAQGISYTYDLFDTGTGRFRGMSLAALIGAAEAKGYAGLNITHPYKTEVIPLLDELSDVAKSVGAANTVVFRDGRRIGHNTDYLGFKMALTTGLAEVRLGTVLLLGAGGAGSAVALALIDCGVQKVCIFDRELDRASALVKQLSDLRPGPDIFVLDDINDCRLATFDGVVNATPVGMEGHPGAVIDIAGASPSVWVADIIYFPFETELLRQAKRKGCQVMNGACMAIFQAVEAFSLITHRKADAARMSATFYRLWHTRQSKTREICMS
jgi:shikimate dehydrogenase